MSTRSAYLWLRIVEVTAIPISVFLFLYVLSGYGLVIPKLTKFLGFDYRVSTYVHNQPLLRYVTTVTLALHCYGGFMLMINRYVKSPALRSVLRVFGLLYAFLLLAASSAAELILHVG